MKYIASIAVAAALFAACSSPQPEQKPIPTPEPAMQEASVISIPLEKLAMPTDTICGMSLADGIGDTLQVGDKLYGFCSSGCKASFAEQIAKK